eukprot:6183873-Pleurochrysis_carterae.AAC.1
MMIASTGIKGDEVSGVRRDGTNNCRWGAACIRIPPYTSVYLPARVFASVHTLISTRAATLNARTECPESRELHCSSAPWVHSTGRRNQDSLLAARHLSD